MADTNPNLTKTSFAKTFVLPALLVFLVPVLSYFFFLHATARFDSGIRASILKQVRADASLSAADRERAIDFFSSHPASELLSNQEFAANLDSTTRFYYATFRWMIRLSLWSIIGGVAVFA